MDTITPEKFSASIHLQIKAYEYVDSHKHIVIPDHDSPLENTKRYQELFTKGLIDLAHDIVKDSEEGISILRNEDLTFLENLIPKEIPENIRTFLIAKIRR